MIRSSQFAFYEQRHDGTFRHRRRGVAGVALSDDGEERAEMGIGVGDYDLDGHLDLLQDALRG